MDATDLALLPVEALVDEYWRTSEQVSELKERKDALLAALRMRLARDVSGPVAGRQHALHARQVWQAEIASRERLLEEILARGLVQRTMAVSSPRVASALRQDPALARDLEGVVALQPRVDFRLVRPTSTPRWA